MLHTEYLIKVIHRQKKRKVTGFNNCVKLNKPENYYKLIICMVVWRTKIVRRLGRRLKGHETLSLRQRHKKKIQKYRGEVKVQTLSKPIAVVCHWRRTVMYATAKWNIQVELKWNYSWDFSIPQYTWSWPCDWAWLGPRPRCNYRIHICTTEVKPPPL